MSREIQIIQLNCFEKLKRTKSPRLACFSASYRRSLPLHPPNTMLWDWLDQISSLGSRLQRIVKPLCSSSTPVQFSGRPLDLESTTRAALETGLFRASQESEVVIALTSCVEDLALNTQREFMKVSKDLSSVQAFGGLTDEALEARVRLIFENSFRRSVDQALQVARDHLDSVSKDEETPHGTFSSVSSASDLR